MSQPCHPGKWQLQPDTQILQSGATPDSHTLHLNRQKTWLAHLAPKRAEDLIASKYDTSRTHSTPHHLHGYSSSPSLRTQVPSLSWAVASGLPASPLAFLCPQLQSLLQGSKLSLIKSMVILCSLDHTTPCSKPLAEFLNDPTNCLCLISYHVPSMGQLWHFHSKTYFHPRSFFWVVPCASNVVLQNICMIQSLAFLFLFRVLLPFQVLASKPWVQLWPFASPLLSVPQLFKLAYEIFPSLLFFLPNVVSQQLS